MVNPPAWAVLGAGGHGLVVLDTLKTLGVNIIGVFDDNPKVVIPEGSPCNRLLGASVELASYPGLCLGLGIGNNNGRQEAFAGAVRMGCECPAIVHPTAFVSPFATLGQGVYVGPHAVVGAGVEVENGVIINTGATVDHHCHIGAWSHLAPGTHLAGNVTVGQGVFVGIGSSVIPGVTVGEGAVVGAGAAVIRPVPPNTVCVGVPARVIKDVEVSNP